MEEKSTFIDLQVLGYFFGGIIPAFMLCIIVLIYPDHKAVDSNYLGFYFLSTFIGAIAGFITTYLHKKRSNSSIFKFSFFLQAVTSVVLVHSWVTFSGGAIESIFSLSYLFIPAVVGYSYGHSKELYIASIALGFSFYLNLFHLEFQRSILHNIAIVGCDIFNHQRSYTSNDFIVNLTYLLIFSSQLGMTIFMVYKNKR